jgi:hypothetical protein
MQITFDTANLSPLDYQVLALLGGVAMGPADEADEAVTPPAKKAPAKKAAAKPEPEPEPMAEEPLEDDVLGEEDDVLGEDPEEDMSDEDLLALAVKKATEMVGGGDAAKVREALDAAGASRVRELNADNVRDFFKALS